MPFLAALQIAAYLAAAAVGVVNSPAYQRTAQESEPPAVVETVEDVPEMEAADG